MGGGLSETRGLCPPDPPPGAIDRIRSIPWTCNFEGKAKGWRTGVLLERYACAPPSPCLRRNGGLGPQGPSGRATRTPPVQVPVARGQSPWPSLPRTAPGHCWRSSGYTSACCSGVVSMPSGYRAPVVSRHFPLPLVGRVGVGGLTPATANAPRHSKAAPW
jgi:hypothetical protein